MATVVNKADVTAPDKSYDSSRFSITPSDTVALRVPVQALFLAVGGDVAVKRGGEDAVTLTLPAGGPHLVGGVTHVMATNTTATGIVGLADGGLN